MVLPKIIHNKKSCLNVKNTDERCFLYCMVAHVTLLHVLKISNMKVQLKNMFNEYDSTGINYPMTINQIPKFEKQNNKSINVCV